MTQGVRGAGPVYMYLREDSDRIGSTLWAPNIIWSALDNWATPYFPGPDFPFIKEFEMGWFIMREDCSCGIWIPQHQNLSRKASIPKPAAWYPLRCAYLCCKQTTKTVQVWATASVAAAFLVICVSGPITSFHRWDKLRLTEGRGLDHSHQICFCNTPRRDSRQFSRALWMNSCI